MAHHLRNVEQRDLDGLPPALRALAQGAPVTAWRLEESHHGGSGTGGAGEATQQMALLGPVEEHRTRLEHLRVLGTDAFTLYLDETSAEGIIDRYGTDVIPTLR